MQIVIKRCLQKDFSAVLDYLWDIKTTTKEILWRVAQIMVFGFLNWRVDPPSNCLAGNYLAHYM